MQKKDYKFNQLVLVYCLNDIGDLFPSSPAPPPSAQILMELEEASWIVRNSYFLNLAYHRYKAARNPVLRDYYPHIADAYRGVLWERQKVRFTQIRDFVRSNGGRLSVVTFPFLHALGPDYEYEFAHENLSEAWRELGVPHLDLLEVYKDIPTRKLVVNAYDAHPNEYANELAARAIDQFLFNPPPSGNQCGESKTDR